ncbi:MAG: peptide chain release factor 1 [Candidatus Omnitrophica bacterium]|nr:peptide chain release factor 1 [Candidatus Omnitrophota bacterium]
MNQQLEKIEKRYLELEELLASPEVISDQNQCSKLAKELSGLRDTVVMFRDLKETSRQIQDLEHMLQEKHDRDFIELAKAEIPDLKKKKAELEERLKQALAGVDKNAGKNVIVEVRQGTGGSEAAMFAGDLFRMYSKYAAKRNWTVETMSSHPTELGGFKEVVFSVKGKDVYSRLKFESGVHRVQRVPTTEAQGRIHTSTATVVVLIEPEDVDMAIEPKDLKIDTYRASGAGGQHVQKTDSAVRITYLPTNLVVTCQDERSQIKNKSKAMRILRARLLDSKEQEEFKKLSIERRSQIGTGDRSEKIRTYNFPDRRVTDHRINFTSYQLESIMEGELDEFSDALIKAAQEKAQQAKETG